MQHKRTVRPLHGKMRANNACAKPASTTFLRRGRSLWKSQKSLCRNHQLPSRNQRLRQSQRRSRLRLLLHARHPRPQRASHVSHSPVRSQLLRENRLRQSYPISRHLWNPTIRIRSSVLLSRCRHPSPQCRSRRHRNPLCSSRKCCMKWRHLFLLRHLRHRCPRRSQKCHMKSTHQLHQLRQLRQRQRRSLWLKRRRLSELFLLHRLLLVVSISRHRMTMTGKKRRKMKTIWMPLVPILARRASRLRSSSLAEWCRPRLQADQLQRRRLLPPLLLLPLQVAPARRLSHLAARAVTAMRCSHKSAVVCRCARHRQMTVLAHPLLGP